MTVITDPGLSGKNLERPGLQQVLAMVDDGHVAHVLVWRLDRLSRDLGDLLLLGGYVRQGRRRVALVQRKIDLSSATGRMFYSVLGAFAQFYREQLAENVRMGMQQAVREGKWINRPKTGYDLIDGKLVPNDMAPIVRRIFRMRGEGASQGDIARATGVNYSLVREILHSRIYSAKYCSTASGIPASTSRSSRRPSSTLRTGDASRGDGAARTCSRVECGAVGAGS